MVGWQKCEYLIERPSSSEKLNHTSIQQSAETSCLQEITKHESARALNSNNFTGGIPPTLGQLSNLFLLDLTANQLSGEIPVSTSSTPGLDQLVGTKHFHFGDNQLTGPISESLFNANMTLIHVYFQNNKFTDPIPESLGLVQTLQIILLDENQFSGSVPKNVGYLRNLTGLNLASNLLSGTVPDLSNATQLNYVDLSNNKFASSPAPGWFSTLTSLNTLTFSFRGFSKRIGGDLTSLYSNLTSKGLNPLQSPSKPEQEHGLNGFTGIWTIMV
ncbi:hypothetical protein BS78_03G315600 [Paspalum vaginatum]|nr:hypothetical protein BS78_03G315600 [Paspalum vaginatum]